MALDDCPDGKYKEATVCHILGNRQCRTMMSERGQSEEQSATMTVLPIELLACGTRGVLLNRLRKQLGEAEDLEYVGQDTKEKGITEKKPHIYTEPLTKHKAPQT